MDAKQKERVAAASKVLRALRHRDFRNEFSSTGRDGNHIVVPALLDDTMGIFFDQLRKSGGTVYIAIPAEDEITVLSLAQMERPDGAAPAPEDCPIHPDTQIQMVLHYLRMTRAPLPCYEAAPGAMLGLVDDRPPAAV